MSPLGILRERGVFESRDLREWGREKKKTVRTEKSEKAAARLGMGIRRTQNTRATIRAPHPPTPSHTKPVSLLACPSGEGHKNTESGKVPVPHSPPTLTTPTSCLSKSTGGGGDQELLPSPWKGPVIPHGSLQGGCGNRKMK